MSASDATQNPTQTIPATTSYEQVVHRPFLFLVLEAERPLASSARYDLSRVTEARLVGRATTRTTTRNAEQLTVEIPDRYLSRQHARIVRDGERWVFQDTSKNGSRISDRLIHQTSAVLSDGDLLELAFTFFIFRTSVPCAPDTPDTPLDYDATREQRAIPELASLLPWLDSKLRELDGVARSTVPVMLFGESGTGKEVLARAVHRLSRRPGDFVGVNCAAIPKDLIESELFGVRKGAFSGATADRPGLIRTAHRGTLLLDEIAEMPEDLQAKLLRVLQQREVVPVGGTQPVSVDVQLVSATNANLKNLVRAGKFRADLFARISGFELELPALRERREDLGIILANLLPRVAPAAQALTFNAGAARTLLQRSWRLNIRELERALAQAVVRSGGGQVQEKHIPNELPVEEQADARGPRTEPMPASEDKRREELVDLLRKHKGNLRAVGREMGKVRQQIQKWMRRYGLRIEDFAE